MCGGTRDGRARSAASFAGVAMPSLSAARLIVSYAWRAWRTAFRKSHALKASSAFAAASSAEPSRPATLSALPLA